MFDIYFLIAGIFFLINYKYTGVKIAEWRAKTNEFIGIKVRLTEWDYKLSKFTSLIVGIAFILLSTLSFFGILN